MVVENDSEKPKAVFHDNSIVSVEKNSLYGTHHAHLSLKGDFIVHLIQYVSQYLDALAEKVSLLEQDIYLRKEVKVKIQNGLIEVHTVLLYREMPSDEVVAHKNKVDDAENLFLHLGRALFSHQHY